MFHASEKNFFQIIWDTENVSNWVTDFECKKLLKVFIVTLVLGPIIACDSLCCSFWICMSSFGVFTFSSRPKCSKILSRVAICLHTIINLIVVLISIFYVLAIHLEMFKLYANSIFSKTFGDDNICILESEADTSGKGDKYLPYINMSLTSLCYLASIAKLVMMKFIERQKTQTGIFLASPVYLD